MGSCGKPESQCSPAAPSAVHSAGAGSVCEATVQDCCLETALVVGEAAPQRPFHVGHGCLPACAPALAGDPAQRTIEVSST